MVGGGSGFANSFAEEVGFVWTGGSINNSIYICTHIHIHNVSTG